MRYVWMSLMVLSLGGCASTPVYNPVEVAVHSQLLLNESAFKEVKEGMSLDQVHTIMGQALTIGYGWQSDTYKPLTIPNPYKTEKIKDTEYFVEYYIESIRQADGVVSDDELMPLIFQDGKLVGRGWARVNALRPTKTAS